MLKLKLNYFSVTESDRKHWRCNEKKSVIINVISKIYLKYVKVKALVLQKNGACN